MKLSSLKGFNLVELMICVAVLAISASIAIPRYAHHIFQKRQTECPAELKKIAAEQQAYFKEHGAYTQDLRQLTWRPPVETRYLYGFRTAPAGIITSTLNVDALCSKKPTCYTNERMKRASGHPLNQLDLPETLFMAQQSFKIGCAGNVDTDAAIDRFTIDQQGQLEHVTNDLE